MNACSICEQALTDFDYQQQRWFGTRQDAHVECAMRQHQEASHQRRTLIGMVLGSSLVVLVFGLLAWWWG